MLILLMTQDRHAARALECWEGAAAKWQGNSKKKERAIAVQPLIARQQEFRVVGPPGLRGTGTSKQGVRVQATGL